MLNLKANVKGTPRRAHRHAHRRGRALRRARSAACWACRPRPPLGYRAYSPFGLSPRIGWGHVCRSRLRSRSAIAADGIWPRKATISTEPSTDRSWRRIARTATGHARRCDIVVCERSSEAISCPVNSAARPDSFATGPGAGPIRPRGPPHPGPATASAFSSEHRNNTVTSSLQCGSPHPRPATPL